MFRAFFYWLMGGFSIYVVCDVLNILLFSFDYIYDQNFAEFGSIIINLGISLEAYIILRFSLPRFD